MAASILSKISVAPAPLLLSMAWACSTPELTESTPDGALPHVQPDAAAPVAPAVDNSPDAAAPPLDSAFCAASRVLQKHCVACHGSTPVAGAPMPLVTPSDLLARSPYVVTETVMQHVRARIHDEVRPMPPGGMLGADELAPLEAWLSADSATQAAATACDAPLPPAPPPAWPADCEQIYTLRSHDPDDPSKPFRVPAHTELQRGVAIEPPWGNASVQALMIRPLIDNAKVVHHWIFASGEPDTFGNWLWGWAPGVGSSVELPKDVGMFLPTGPINLNMHYYNTGDTEELDTSGLEICTTTRFRPKTATVGMDFNALPIAIPTRQRSEFEDVCRIVKTTDEDIHVLALAPHMHKLGTHMFVSVTHEGVEKVLHDGAYEFLEQHYYPLEDVVLHDNDVVRTRCTYQNDSDVVVEGGESSDQEMCVAFALHWPMGGYLCLPL